MSDASRIHLRDWREADLPALTRWRNDVDLQSQLLARVRGSSLDQVREWARKRSVAATSLLQVVAMCDGDRAIGYVQLVGLDDLDQCGDLGICLEPESQGAGLGRSAIAQFMTYVCKRRPIRKFELRVRADNVKAIRCYEAVGFMRCGLLHARAFVGSRYEDVVLMERFLCVSGTEVALCAL